MIYFLHVSYILFHLNYLLSEVANKEVKLYDISCNRIYTLPTNSMLSPKQDVSLLYVEEKEQ